MAQIDTNSPAKPSFEELQRQAEEAAGMPADSELYGEWMTSPEPDETGRVPASRPEEAVAAADEPAAEEEAPSEEPAAVEAAPEPDRLEELNQKLGQLINENAEMRRALSEQPEPQVQPQRLDEGTVTWFDEYTEQDPGGAAYWALTQQQPMLYDRAIRSWYDQDPVAAGRYERQVEQAQFAAQLEQKSAPQQQAASRQQMEDAMSAVAARHDDFGQVLGTLNEEKIADIVKSGMPAEILERGLAGSREDKERVFETMYRWVKADMAGQLAEAAAQAQAKSSEEARQAKIDATVASASTTTPPPVEESEAERQARVWQEMRPSLRDGWEGRDSRARLGR